MTYPAAVLSIAAAATAFLLAFIVPTFAEMFSDYGAELPAPTRVVLALSEALTAYALPLAFALAAAVLGGRRLARTERGRRLVARLLLRIPLLGPLRLKGLLAEWCRTLGTLLRSGVHLEEALALMARATADPLLAEEAHRLLRAVREGRALTATLARSGLFPPMLAQMLAAGEETAALDEMLLHVAGHYDAEVEGAVDALVALLEPALIVVIGVVLGGVLVAMYLPMFEMTSVMGP